MVQRKICLRITEFRDRGPMPTLFRLLSIMFMLAIVAFAAIYMLATRVVPEQRDLSITVQEKNLDKK